MFYLILKLELNIKSLFPEGAVTQQHILSFQTNPRLELLPTDNPF